MTGSYERAVASWEDHLRAGGTTTWSAWREHVGDTGAATQPSRPTPDATHLELVRRLNTRADGADPGLHELVLHTPSPGRGLVDVPLPWPEQPRRFGTPAVEPDLLPTGELVRLAVGVLASLLPGVAPTRAAREADRWPFPWRTRFRVHGSPGTAAGVRRLLLDQGAVESDWRPTHLVVGRPLEVMLAEHWARSTQDAGILKWGTLWRRTMASGLPAYLSLPDVAEDLATRPGESVHVVVATDAQHVAARAARLLGRREEPLATRADPAEADLLRRLNRLLALTEGPGWVRELAGRLVASVLPPPTPGHEPPPLGVPAAARTWAQETATAMAERLRRAEYPVDGNPGDLVPAPHLPHGPGGGTVDSGRTLELALDACVGAWHRQEGRS